MKKKTNIFGKFKMRVVLLILSALMLVTIPLACNGGNGKEELGPIPEGGARVTFNYFRPDQNYTGWNMWLWAKGTGSIKDQNDFTSDVRIGDMNWKSLTATTDGAVTPDEDDNLIGFLVRLNEWEEKDVDADRFVTSDKFVDQQATVYLISGYTEIFYNEADAIEAMNESMRKRIKVATFTSFERIYFETSDKITTQSVFKLKDQDGNVIATLDCSKDGTFVGDTYGSISLPKGVKLDVKKTYTLVDEPETIDEDINFSKATVGKGQAYGSKDFDEMFKYDGTLGAEYTAAQTKFTVWSPYATSMKVNIYEAGEGGEATSYDMTEGEKGTWTYTLTGDQKNKYYTYTVSNGLSKYEVVDPYARSGGKNGKRGMIVDLASTNPAGWDTQTIPTLNSNSEAVIYEAQLRDLTIHESSGVTAANRGKFLGLTETGTKNASGKSTALDYLKDLGVTQVHFQPLFDFASVDESFTTATYNKDGEYNWGYDPLNYNMPEGSYSSDPSDGTKRVTEMKQMVMALHNAGIQVVMDVVYNHVSNAQDSNFEKLMPGYFFRMTDKGTFWNGSGCGNETASDHSMFSKFMIDSVKYWAEEYKIDGFRFDLMGLHDIDTMNAIYDELKEINEDVIVYGEGWTGGDSGLSSSKQAILSNAKKMPNIAFFNDTVRDGLKGSVFNMDAIGYVSGDMAGENVIYTGAQGTSSVFAAPTQSINYAACHDNSLLWDKLDASVKADVDTRKAMNRLSAVAVLTSQGISFFPAGEEMLRSKPTTKGNSYDNRETASLNNPNYYFSDNSYKSPDSVNAIDWNNLDTNADMVEFYKQLIAIKKTFPQFQLTTKDQITELVIANKDGNKKDGIAVYAVKDPSSDKYAVVVFNNGAAAKTVGIPQGDYSVFVNGDKANATTALSTFTGNSVEIGARSAMVMTVTLDKAAIDAWTYSVA